MMDKLMICAAAFFRSRGRNFVTGKEFVNEISLNLHWMSKSDAECLLSTLVEKNILKKSGEYFKPSFDVLSVKNIPIGYRPEQNFVNDLKSVTSPQSSAEGLLTSLVAEAEKHGIRKEDFVSETITIRDKLDIDILAAGLAILKNKGVNIDKMSDIIYEQISSKSNLS